MNKARDSKRDLKKAPVKTLKEKRIEKHEKKDARQHPDFLVKPIQGTAH